jgi:soluble lytic murein transglycosylase-like protein
LWFDEAYKYRKDSDPYVKPANVAIISATRQNFLRVRCPNTHNNIIVSSAPAPAPIIQQEAQLNIDTVKNLRYADNPDITWRTDDYTLPSHLKDGYIKNEIQTTGTLKRQEINPPEIYINIARNASSKNGVLLKFLLAIAEVASEYNQNKISDQGKKLGIMQLSSDIAEYYRYDRDDLFNPEKAFDITSLYIKDLNKNYNGDINNIVRAYYMGLLPNNTTTQPADTPETRIFATEIIRRIDINQSIVF